MGGVNAARNTDIQPYVQSTDGPLTAGMVSVPHTSDTGVLHVDRPCPASSPDGLVVLVDDSFTAIGRSDYSPNSHRMGSALMKALGVVSGNSPLARVEVVSSTGYRSSRMDSNRDKRAIASGWAAHLAERDPVDVLALEDRSRLASLLASGAEGLECRNPILAVIAGFTSGYNHKTSEFDWAPHIRTLAAEHHSRIVPLQTDLRYRGGKPSSLVAEASKVLAPLLVPMQG